MSKTKINEIKPEKNSFEPTYSMQIPVLHNSDNFRIDKKIEEYQNKINSIAKMIIPEQTKPAAKSEIISKNTDTLAKIKFKKVNTKKLLRINDAIVDKMLENKIGDQKVHQNLITRLAKGDTKFMDGIPQLKSKDGLLLNSPITKVKLEHFKNEAILELKKIDDSYENKITEINNITLKNKNNTKNNSSNKKNKNHKINDASLFLTGVTAEERKADFFPTGHDNKDSNNMNTNLNKNENKFIKKRQESINHFSSKSQEKNHFNKESIDNNFNLNNENDQIKNIRNIIKEKRSHNQVGILTKLKERTDLIYYDKNTSNTYFKTLNFNKTHLNLNQTNYTTLNYKNRTGDFNIANNQNISKLTDSDLLSDENRCISFNEKEPIKSIGSVNSKNFQRKQESFNFLNNLNSIKNFNNLEKLKKKADFFKLDMKTKSLKNLQNPKDARMEKKFLKTNYLKTMNEFLSTVNTEVDQYNNTFSNIERGIKNYDFIQSIHANIPPDKLMDKKMMFHDNFVRKYFIYGTQGGQFISEDKTNDDIIERSDNLAKITPEISYKFKKLILDKFSEKPLIDFKTNKEQNSYKAEKSRNISKKVAQLIDETDKRKARVDNDLSLFFLKTKEN